MFKKFGNHSSRISDGQDVLVSEISTGCGVFPIALIILLFEPEFKEVRRILKDRGNIKWTAMMLPEHVAMLRKLKEKTNYKTKPILDEQFLEELNEMIYISMKANKTIKLTYYHEHDYKSMIGVIQSFDSVFKFLYVVNEGGSSLQLKIENIIDIKMID